MNGGKIDLAAFRREGAFVHFIGCGGAGTRPLMKIFSELGFRVSGSDMVSSEGLETLREEGFAVAPRHRKENLPEAGGNDLLVVYSSAIPKENEELAEAKRRHAVCLLRGEALGLVCELFPSVIAVSGSHGKTSVSAMITHILEKLDLHPGYLVGGNIPGKKWNGSAGNGKFFVCEADESDGTHTAIRSACAVVTNIEDDHVWNFSSPQVLLDNFRTFAQKADRLVYNAGKRTDELYSAFPDAFRIDLTDPLPAQLPGQLGLYQKMNAVTAARTVEIMGCAAFDKALSLLADFPGIERRLSLRYKGFSRTLIEDYAHHPTELAASLKSLRAMFPGKKLFVIFQPHRYARLERYFKEFTDVLSSGEAAPDKVFITPVFAAWTAKSRVSSELLAQAAGERAEAVSGSWQEMAHAIAPEIPEGAVAAVIGAGDIHEIIPFLRKELEKRDLSRQTGVIIAAGGSSSRFGGGCKLFSPLAGIPLFLHCIRNFIGVLPLGHLVIAVPPALKEEFREKCNELHLPEGSILFADGGSCREESVRNALKILPDQVRIVAVHDAARPFASAELLGECVCQAQKYGAAIAARKISDTVKEASEDGFILRTVPREKLWAVQTPQVFRRELLEEAFRKAEGRLGEFTDDASLAETFLQIRPKLAETRTPNLKITYAEDLALAEAIFSKFSR